MTLAAINF